MYKKIKGGTMEVIGGHEFWLYLGQKGITSKDLPGGLECWTPPRPPIEEISGSHLPKKEQVWIKPELPKYFASEIEIWSGDEYEPTDEIDWDTARREEIIKQTGADPWNTKANGDSIPVKGVERNENYVSEPLEEFRAVELDRCDPVTGGHWFMNNGKAVWLTPFHYFFLAWWQLDSGWAEYRETDRWKFYFWQYCYEDMMCYGMTEADKRGGGKSARGGSVVYLDTIYKRNCHSGIQSKTDEDALGFFAEKISDPYKHLPDFFIPINSNTSDPTEKMRFFALSKKGKNSAQSRKEQKKSLQSHISVRNSKEKAYDSTTIRGILFRDEEGKTITCDIMARHDVTKECVYRDGRMIGKIYSTTTVAQMDKGGKQYKELYDLSNPAERDEMGFSKSGLYKLFLPAYLTEFSDRYGMPVPDKPTQEQREYLVVRYGDHAARGAKYKQKKVREGLEDNQESLQINILQYPWTEKELFSHEGKNCQYNLQILRRQEGIVNDPDFDGIAVGDFVPIDGWGTDVKWVSNTINGKWNVRKDSFLSETEANKVNKVGSQWIPMNDNAFSGGFDPTKSHNNELKRRSMAAGTIFAFHNPLHPDNTDTWIADYVWKPDDPEQAWMEFIYGCWYFGCKMLPEMSIILPKFMLRENSAEQFIMNRPETTFTTKRGLSQSGPGLPASDKTNDYMLRKKKTHIQHQGHKLLLPRVIQDSIGFTPELRTKYDVEVGSQLSLTATEKLTYSPPEEATDIDHFFEHIL